jgi:hypothetical protein
MRGVLHDYAGHPFRVSLIQTSAQLRFPSWPGADNRAMLCDAHKLPFLTRTGILCYASEVVKDQVARPRDRTIDRGLPHLLALTEQGVDVLRGKESERMRADPSAILRDGRKTRKQLFLLCQKLQENQYYQ